MRWKCSTLIGLMIAINLLLICSLYIQRNKFERHYNDSYVYNLYFDLLFGNIKMKYNYENIKLNDFVCENVNDKQLNFSSLLDQDYKLFFVFSHLNCISCVDSAIKEFIEFAQKNDTDRFIIIGEYSNIRELKAYLNEKKVNIPIYFTKANSIPILQKENVPYVFMMKDDMLINLLFIPIKELKDFSIEYYKILNKRFITH